MLRLIIVLAIAFAASQFPQYYFGYIFQIDEDARQAATSGAPQWSVDLLKQQRSDLLAAEPYEWPFRFIDAFDSDRATHVLGTYWEPQVPEEPVDWAYGGVGLIIGFFVTGILFSPFGQRSRRNATAVTSTARPAKPVASRIPMSAGKNRATVNQAQDAARQAVAGNATATAASVSQADARRSEAAEIAQAQMTGGAVRASYYRPPAVTRRRGHDFAGPVSRRVKLRD